MDNNNEYKGVLLKELKVIKKYVEDKKSMKDELKNIALNKITKIEIIENINIKNINVNGDELNLIMYKIN